ncbi:MAG TPA: hypothetical protein PLZ62_00345 [bacterium]|nr:hypothetical protein [bacterium]
MNRHFVKNIILIICWAALTFITDTLIINYFCFDTRSINVSAQPDFYELEMCIQSKDIIFSSIYIYAGLMALIGIIQLIQSIIQKKSSSDVEDVKQLQIAAQSLIIISACLTLIMQTSLVI